MAEGEGEWELLECWQLRIRTAGGLLCRVGLSSRKLGSLLSMRISGMKRLLRLLELCLFCLNFFLTLLFRRASECLNWDLQAGKKVGILKGSKLLLQCLKGSVLAG